MQIDAISGMNPIDGVGKPPKDYGYGVQGVTPPAIPTLPGSEAAAGTQETFGQMLQNAIGQVNQAQIHAGDMTARFAAGEPMDIHQLMIASQEAGVALNLAMQVRNKLTDGYSEIMHTNI